MNMDISNVEDICCLVFKTDTHYYVWLSDKVPVKMQSDIPYRIEELSWLQNHSFQKIDIAKDHEDYVTDCDKYWLAFVADCAFPNFYLISADSESDALEAFETDCEFLVRIDEDDLDDYDSENLNYNANGTPVDTEALVIQPLLLTAIYRQLSVHN